jgi:hypothetical protein
MSCYVPQAGFELSILWNAGTVGVHHHGWQARYFPYLSRRTVLCLVLAKSAKDMFPVHFLTAAHPHSQFRC